MVETEKPAATLQEAVAALMDKSSYYFYRSFSMDTPKNKTMSRRVNDLFESDKSLEPALLMLSLMPALRWVEKAKRLDKTTELLFANDEDIYELGETQKILAMITGYHPKLILQQRQMNFKKIHYLVQSCETKMEKIRRFPGKGREYADVLCAYFCGVEPTNVRLTQYRIDQHFADAVRLFSSLLNDKDKELIYEIISKKEKEVGDDIEFQYVYHNVGLLLNEYCKIVWYATDSDDKAMRLLKCRSETEMLSITQSDSKYYQAYMIVEYIKLIDGAINLLKDFPNPEYYKVLRTTIDMKKSGVSEDVTIAQQLQMSRNAYRQTYRNAMAVLATALFGSDCHIFVDILATKV